MSASEEILNTSDIQKLGIIAGRGLAPKLLAESCERQNIEPFIVALEEHTEPALVEGRAHMWSHLGAAGTIIKTLQQHEVRDLVLIGGLPRPHLSEIKPDLKTAAFFAKVGMKALGDHDLLSAVKSFLKDEGFTLHGVQKFAGDLLASEGLITKAKPNKQDQIDIARGIEISQALGLQDVGQAVIVQNGLVLAVEAIEGTDEMISRAASLKRKHKGGVLVKTCKPQQDRDLDLPTIGVHTVEAVHESGFHGIAVHAGQSLILDREAVVARANDLKIFITGVTI